MSAVANAMKANKAETDNQWIEGTQNLYPRVKAAATTAMLFPALSMIGSVKVVESRRLKTEECAEISLGQEQGIHQNYVRIHTHARGPTLD